MCVDEMRALVLMIHTERWLNSEFSPNCYSHLGKTIHKDNKEIPLKI